MVADNLSILIYVGGMSNIIQYRLNSYLVYPDEESFFIALKGVLLMDKLKFNKMVIAAYESTLLSFSKEKME